MYERKCRKIHNFLLPIKKELHNRKRVIYKIRFIDSCMFMLGSFSSLIDNLSEIFITQNVRSVIHVVTI